MPRDEAPGALMGWLANLKAYNDWLQREIDEKIREARAEALATAQAEQLAVEILRAGDEYRDYLVAGGKPN